MNVIQDIFIIESMTAPEVPRIDGNNSPVFEIHQDVASRVITEQHRLVVGEDHFLMIKRQPDPCMIFCETDVLLVQISYTQSFRIFQVERLPV